MQPETNTVDPLQLLRELEQRSQAVARGLPMQEESRDYWRGVGFTLGGHALLAPLCVMAVPLYDMISVIWIRLREGRSPFEADKNHFSHRLVDLGLTKGQAVLTIYLTTATCGLGALLLHRTDVVGATFVILMIVCILALIAILESTARRRLNQ